MRHFLSKAIAGGLSAALVLLWCPLLFPADTLSSWLVRGVAWTIMFELLLHSLAPFEEGVWEAGESRFRDPSKRRVLRRAAPVASVALAAAVVMLAVGLDRPAPLKAEAERRPVRIVHVTKVVRPLTVKRVVEAPAPAPAAPAAAETPVVPPPAGETKAAAKPKRRPRPAPKAKPAPKAEIGKPAPEESTPVCSGTCAEPVPATGSSL